MQLTRQEIIEKLKEILIEEQDSASLNNITEDSNLAVDVGLNSVGMLFMVIAIEESFNIRFEGVGIEDFKTIRDVVDYIMAKLI
jgi:acyl carrier protein